MKTIFRCTVLLSFLLLFSSSLFANGTPSKKKPYKVEKNEESEDCIKPRVPGRTYILCWISATEIEVEVPEGTEYVDLTLSANDAVVWETTVTCEEPAAPLPSLLGEYDLTCRTDGNHTYSATIIID